MKIALRMAVLGAVCAAGAGVVRRGEACQVPVFRYALERWEPASWKVVVFHRGPLSADQQRLVDNLNAPADESEHLANTEAATIDLAKNPPPEAEDIYRRSSPRGLPWVVLIGATTSPPTDRSEGSSPYVSIIASGPLQEQSIRQFVDSPMRRELARRLLKGDSAVWVLLESGDKAKDDAIAATLTKELKRLETELKLPENLDAPSADSAAPPADSVHETFDAAQPSPGVPLRLAFSVLRLSRRDAAEQVFVRTLLDSDNRLQTQTDPVAFPVFGRGRVLASLCGSEIEPEAISGASEFLISNCSCIVKGERPGTDLLMAANWAGLLEGRFAVDKALPPLTGVMPIPEPSSTAASPQTSDGTRSVPATSGSNGLLRNVGIVLAVVVAAAAAGTVLLWRRGRETP